MKLYVRRIWNVQDIIFIYNGIIKGIEEKVFTEHNYMDLMRDVVNKDITFYIFYTDSKVVEIQGRSVGFGAINNDREVYHVFVVPSMRGKGVGIRISLWLKKTIMKKKERIPISFVKKTNKWKEVVEKQGMRETKHYRYTVFRMRLEDLKQYVECLEKYKIDEIQFVPKVKPKATLGMWER